MSDIVWMQHDEHGGYARLPDITYWRAYGWKPSGPPPEPDLLHDPGVEATEDPETPPDAGSSAVRPEAEDDEEMTRG